MVIKQNESINRPCNSVHRITFPTYRVHRHDLDTRTRTSANWPTELQNECGKKSPAITKCRYALWQNMAQRAVQDQLDLAPENSSASQYADWPTIPTGPQFFRDSSTPERTIMF